MPTTSLKEKVLVSIVSRDMPLERCPLGTRLYIKKDYRNTYDSEALSALVKHKKTGKWTFIGFIAAKDEYLTENGINNKTLYSRLDPIKLDCEGKVIGKHQVTFSYGYPSTALIVEISESSLAK